jgi:succinate-acetate transporter protein
VGELDREAALPLRIFLRPVGTPLTIGMAGLAIASLVQGGLDLDWVPQGQESQVGLILLTVPFLLQLLACVFAYLARDGAAGAALGVLSTTWLGLGVVHIASSPGAISQALGLMLLACGTVLALSAVAVAAAKLLPAGIFLLVALRLVLAGVYELSGAGGWQEAAGIVSLIVLAAAGYALLAFELEGQQRRPVLPTFRRGDGRAAVLGDAGDQVEGVIHEAGVRRTT